MGTSLDDQALDQLFRAARTYNRFKPDPVSDEIIHQLYELLKWGPTAFNSQPSRYVFIHSQEAKERLALALSSSSSNREKTVQAPLNVIIAYDMKFFEHLPKLTAAPKAIELFEQYPELLEPTLIRNGSLQAGYLILAARALGLDVGLLTGFKANMVNQEFFPNGRFEVNLIANLGYGDASGLYPRGHRFLFDEVGEIL